MRAYAVPRGLATVRINIPTNRSVDMPTVDHQPHFLPIPEAAQMLGVGRSKLYELLKTGDLHACHLGRRTVISVLELRAFSRTLALASGIPAEIYDRQDDGASSAEGAGFTTQGREA
jgi:excisionase family DNA binding protein